MQTMTACTGYFKMPTRSRYRRNRRPKPASLNYENMMEATVLNRQRVFEERTQMYDVLIIIGVGIAMLGLPSVFLMFWILGT
ncbi:hypothetical protein [Caballeronia sp. LZ032]|uniref:hypothetical protein n=1 Tax=Caballeronia sp. LZ032 TaxID=3038565 RepID=UPI0028612FCF|nr:hypothetical protein [Caballeronia sp. LZ032]MDR5881141.1 hypothetical protein [Caballeronia sp. LZ032]